jgi:Tfp pilus assembly protein PilF
MLTVAQALDQAVQRHQAGQLQQAEQLYRAILQGQPQQVDALHLLGLLAYQVGKHELASAYLGRALRVRPDYAEAHLNLGTILQAQGKFAEAQTSYQQALRLKPDFAEAHNNLGNLLQEQGQLAPAQASYQQALRLKPNFAEAHNNLGNVLKKQGQLAEAVAYYQQALRLEPDYAEAHSNLGTVLKEQGNLAGAQASLEQALRLEPASAEGHTSLGNVLREQGQFVEAVASYQQALRLKPDSAEAHSNLGAAFQEQGQLEKAQASYQQALRLKPDSAEVLINLGIVLKEQGELEGALASLQRALHLQPDSAEAHLNLGTVLQDQGRLAEALASYEQALRLKPDYAKAHWNRALAWLLAGDFEQAWRDYEWRWQVKGFSPPRLPQPLWDGSPLHGQTILLCAEWGLGDTLQFIRYAPLVQALGGSVLVVCQSALVPLLRSCPGIDRLLPEGSALPVFDVWAPLLSLPRILGTSLATIPAQVPYLRAATERVESWRQELSPLTAFQIGIAWDVDSRTRHFHLKRCIPLTAFAPLGQLEGVRLISLQKGPGAEQLRTLAGSFPVTDLSSRLDQVGGAFMDTAAVMQSLDLVVTADTSIAHLAGALEVPVWVALPRVPDWRWLLEREDSPWYPSLRLFRQQERGNWDEVFARMAAALKQRLAQGSGTQADSGHGSNMGGTP